MCQNKTNIGDGIYPWLVAPVALEQPFFGNPIRSVLFLKLLLIVCAHQSGKATHFSRCLNESEKPVVREGCQALAENNAIQPLLFYTYLIGVGPA